MALIFYNAYVLVGSKWFICIVGCKYVLLLGKALLHVLVCPIVLKWFLIVWFEMFMTKLCNLFNLMHCCHAIFVDCSLVLAESGCGWHCIALVHDKYVHVS